MAAAYLKRHPLAPPTRGALASVPSHAQPTWDPNPKRRVATPGRRRRRDAAAAAVEAAAGSTVRAHDTAKAGRPAAQPPPAMAAPDTLHQQQAVCASIVGDLSSEDGVRLVRVGFGRIVALYHRSHQIFEQIRYLCL